MLLLANCEGRCGVPKAVELLRENANGLRAMVEGIKLVEDSLDVHSVGQSSWPNILGELELDAAVMDGNTRRTGAVGAITGFRHPVEIAYDVMRRMDHEILVGEGAERFARETGAIANQNETEHSVQAWTEHLKRLLSEEQRRLFPNINLLGLRTMARDPERMFDTTVYLSVDHEQRISTATSTSGCAWKYPGRLGDSPIIGAGSYADSRYGACACTHTGEMTIRAGTARTVVQYLKMGYALKDAVAEAACDLVDLRTGSIGTVVIYAINGAQEHVVLSVNSTAPIKYLVWHDKMQAPEVREAGSYRA